MPPDSWSFTEQAAFGEPSYYHILPAVQNPKKLFETERGAWTLECNSPLSQDGGGTSFTWWGSPKQGLRLFKSQLCFSLPSLQRSNRQRCWFKDPLGIVLKPQIVQLYFLTNYFIVVLLQLSNFFLLYSPPPSPPPLPQSIPTLLSMPMGHSYMFFDWSLPLPSTTIPPPLPSGHCQSVPCICDSGSILLIYFVD